jgi:hypothetical protein
VKIVRVITYEGTEEQLRKQMDLSLKDGRYPGWLTSVTIETTHNDIPGLEGQTPENWGRGTSWQDYPLKETRVP